MSTVMLMVAVVGSLVLGVAVAYGLCQAMFRIFRVHAESAAKGRVASSGVQ